jgi:hypothetical protein
MKIIVQLDDNESIAIPMRMLEVRSKEGSYVFSVPEPLLCQTIELLAVLLVRKEPK